MIDRHHPDIVATAAIQQAVSDPTTSAWVSANAGSGKTYVLTRRVIRLLITQALSPQRRAAPERILCITFTKAAAAEMEVRLFKDLSDWALADDAVLADALESYGVRDRSPATLARVRCLFAQALETPGGLKIQTIHSFCERILRRFPIEAGLVPGFVVSDERVTEFREKAIESALLQCTQPLSPSDVDAVLRMAGTPADLQKLLSPFLKEVQAHDWPTVDPWIDRVAAALGVDSQKSVDDVFGAVASRLDLNFLERLAEPQYKFGKRLADKAGIVRSLRPLHDADPSIMVSMLIEQFLSGDGQPYSDKWLGLVGAAKTFPSIYADYDALSQLLVSAQSDLARHRSFENTAALMRLAWTVHQRTEKEQSRTQILAFDDLIIRAKRLLQQTSGSWVMFKLDGGLDHILLDEAQDTASPQWSVIESFRDEFFGDQGARAEGRTFFCVGDLKQSIYSFQGADAALFDAKHDEMTEAVRGRPFLSQQLFVSFRSSSAVLDVVDAIFEGQAAAGVSDRAEVRHRPAKIALPGRVQLWPVILNPEKEAGDPWDRPVTALSSIDPHRQLAERIAQTIAEWLADGRRRLGNGQPIQPGDILILCQKRKKAFYEIIRALTRRGIPISGTDRVRLKEDIAVDDLTSAFRFACNQEDDLSLAEILKSPLYGYTDEDLFELCFDRRDTSVWTQLQRAAGRESGGRAASVVNELQAARRRGEQLGPYAFLSSLLEGGVPTGWRRFRRRLGQQSDEALNELLNMALSFERQNPRGLLPFLMHLESTNTDIKKDIAADGGVVRIMTVHGAKGLEGPIVFLADCTSEPDRSQSRVVKTRTQGADAFIYAPTKSDSKDPLLQRILADQKEAEYAEYRRKLYVAATRAEEELIFCGVQRGKKKSGDGDEADFDPHEASWHDMVTDAFRRLQPVEQVTCPWDEERPILVYQKGNPAVPADKDAPPSDKEEIEVSADWLHRPAAPESASRIYFPSQTITGEAANFGPVLHPGESTATDPRLRGTMLHLLLEVLTLVAPTARRQKAEALLALRAPTVSSEMRAEWIAEVVGVMEAPELDDIFSPDGLAEVPVHGVVNGRNYAGQIDRLIIHERTIRIVDYKSHRLPPADIHSVPSDIIGQMAVYATLLAQIYPDRAIEAGILWTAGPALMWLAPEILRAAMAGVT